MDLVQSTPIGGLLDVVHREARADAVVAEIDFFTVSTATFRVLYCFVILRHDRRRVVHFNI